MSGAGQHPATRLLLGLCERRLDQTMAADQPLLAMLVENEDPAPLEMATLLDRFAAVYANAACDIRRRHYLGARHARRSPSARTPTFAAATG
jgi:hypothetical protein